MCNNNYYYNNFIDLGGKTSEKEYNNCDIKNPVLSKTELRGNVVTICRNKFKIFEKYSKIRKISKNKLTLSINVNQSFEYGITFLNIIENYLNGKNAKIFKIIIYVNVFRIFQDLKILLHRLLVSHIVNRSYFYT